MEKKTYTPPMTDAVEMDPCLLMAGSGSESGPSGGGDGGDGGDGADVPDFEGPSI